MNGSQQIENEGPKWHSLGQFWDKISQSMKPIFPILLLFCIQPLCAVSADQEAEQLLKDARQQANIFHKDAEPFQLEADFVAQVQTPLHGHITLKWESSGHWWRKVTMADFVEIDVRNGEKQYTTRNGAFTPARVTELIRLMEFPGNTEGVVKKKKQRVENGVELTCLKVEAKAIERMAREVCLSSSHEILKSVSTWGSDEQRIESYTDYEDFKGRRYPQKLEVEANGSKVLTATVTGLTTASFDQALLTPPNGAIERRHCKDFSYAVPIKTPDPMYPMSASPNKMMGDTTVSITVETDGSVSDVHLLGGSTQSMDDATQKTIRGWKFKPAMCGAEPVISDMEVVVSFRMYRRP